VNPIRQLQEDVASRLRATEYMLGIPMVTESLGSTEGVIATAMAKAGLSENPNGKSGVSILILTPFGRSMNNDATSLVALDITVRVSVFESPIVNFGASGIAKPAIDVMWQAVCLLHSWTPGPGRKPARLIRFDSAEDDDGSIAYTADFAFPRSLDRTLFP
jgi:hypothetical protein